MPAFDGYHGQRRPLSRTEDRLTVRYVAREVGEERVQICLRVEVSILEYAHGVIRADLRMRTEWLEIVQGLYASGSNGYITRREFAAVLWRYRGWMVLWSVPAERSTVTSMIAWLPATLAEVARVHMNALHTRSNVIDVF